MGKVIAQRYRVEHLIGEGAAGSVFLVRDSLEEGRLLALKMLEAPGLRHLELLRHEFSTLTKLRHPNIARVHDFGLDESSGLWFYTSDYVDGPTVTVACQKQDVEYVCRIFSQLLRALEYIHSQGIVHYDIKPDNILVNTDNTVKIIDFGLASTETPAGMRMRGTVGYAAPEVVRGEQADRRADLYSTGVVLYEAIAGRPPFKESSAMALLRKQARSEPPVLSEFISDVPAALEKVILCLLEREPALRYQSANEVIRALSQAAGMNLEEETTETAAAYLLSGRFVGRNKELGYLTGLVDTLGEKALPTPVVFVTGEPGIGKTRLLREVGYHAQLQGIAVTRGSCSSVENRPFGPLSHIIPATRIAGARHGITPGMTVAAEVEQGTGVHAAAESIIQKARERPLLIVVDNAEDARGDTLSLIEHVTQLLLLKSGRTERIRLLILVAIDSETARRKPVLKTAERLIQNGLAGEVTLPPISIQAARSLIASMLGSSDLPFQAVDSILQAGEGNPLRIEQILQELADSGVLFYESGKWRVSTQLAELKAPKGGEDVLRRRLEGASETERSVASALACIGRPASFEMLQTAAGARPDSCASAVEQLLARRVLVSDAEGSYSFANGRMDEILLDRLSKRDIADIHRHIYSFLAGRAAGRQEDDTELIERVLHAETAALDEKELLPLLREGALRAERTGALSAATQLYEALKRKIAEDSQEWFEILERLADLYWRGAGAEKVLECLELADRDRLWNYPDIAARITSRFISARIRAGSLDEAEHFAAKAMKRLGFQEKGRYRARITVEMADVLEARGEMKKARKLLLEARGKASMQKDYRTLNLADFRLAVLEFRLRRLSDSARRGRLLLGRKSAAGMYAGVHNILGLVYREKGDSEGALEQFHLSLDAYEKEGNLSAASYVRSNIGMVLYDRGEFGQALDAYLGAKRLFRIISDEVTYGSVLVSIGKAHLALGRVQEALALYNDALEVEQSATSPVTRMAALICRADVLAILGKTKPALDDTEQVLRDVRRSGAKNIEAMALAQRAHVLAYHCGDIGAAKRDLARARELDVSDFPAAAFEVLTLSALLSALEGDDTNALRFSRAAENLKISSIARREADVTRAETLLLLHRADAADGILNTLEDANLTARTMVRAACLRAKCAHALGDIERAQSLARRAVKEAARFGDVVLEFQAALKAAECDALAGDNQSAGKYVEQASDALKRISEEFPDEYSREALRSSPFFSQLDLLESELRDLKPDTRAEAASSPIEGEILGETDMNEQFPMREGLALLGMVTRLAGADLEVQKILSLALSMVIDITQAGRGFIVLVDKAGNMKNVVARDILDEEIRSPEYQTSHTMVRDVIRTGKSRLVSDAMLDELLREAKSVVDLGLRSVLCVPVMLERRTTGVVYLDTTSLERGFSEADLILIEAFAQRIAPIIQHAVMQEQLQARLHSLEEEVRTRYAYTNIVGQSKPIRELFHLLDSVTDTDLTVYLYGETGTGKELVAKALHYNSGRKDAPFLTVNCAAMPASLLESELFGYTKGAFTGADSDREGLIAAAAEGTLFLDEIGAMPLEMQAKLLRFMEEREVRRLGSTTSMPVNLRVICASNTLLENQVEQGAFREDLFYRINVVKIEMPPLRERREDIMLLSGHFVKQFAKETGAGEKSIDKDASAKLCAGEYPGNVRQLRNIIQQAFVMSGDSITLTDIEAVLNTQKQESTPDSAVMRKLSLEEYMREFVLFHQVTCSETELAGMLGVSRQHLWQKRKAWNMPRPK